MAKDRVQQVKFELALVKQALDKLRSKIHARRNPEDDYIAEFMIASEDHHNLLWREAQLEREIDFI